MISLYASMDNIDIDEDEIDEISLKKEVDFYKLTNPSVNLKD